MKQLSRIALQRVVFNLLAAAITPFVNETAWIHALYKFGDSVPGSTNFISQIVSSVVGFVFVVRALGIYSVLVGIVYFPLMVCVGGVGSQFSVTGGPV